MRIQFFTIPIHAGNEIVAELNAFLSSHRVVSVAREFVADGQNSCWAFSVTWTESDSGQPTSGRRSRIDYKDVLSEQHFAVFARLRELRKEIAERDGVPPYALFTNEQLAKMVTESVTTASDLQKIPGIGPSRIEKYGEVFLKMLKSPATDTYSENAADEASESQP